MGRREGEGEREWGVREVKGKGGKENLTSKDVGDARVLLVPRVECSGHLALHARVCLDDLFDASKELVQHCGSNQRTTWLLLL